MAWMADRIAQATTATGTEAADVAEPTAKSMSPLDPATAAFTKADTELTALAIVAKEGRNPGDRTLWHGALVRLGKHLAPDVPPPVQLQRALQDERGHAFLAAKMAVKP